MPSPAHSSSVRCLGSWTARHPDWSGGLCRHLGCNRRRGRRQRGVRRGGPITGQLASFLLVLSSLIGVLMVAVPAIYYETGDVVTVEGAYQHLTARFWRYVLAGLFFSLLTSLGFVFCVLPGIAIALVMPVYVNRIFVTDLSIGDAFSQAFQKVYRSENGLAFVGLEILTGLLVVVLTLLTCGLAAVVAVPMGSFVLQKSAYQRGLLR